MFEQLKIFIDVFRPKRWYRNAFMLLGSAMAVLLNHVPVSQAAYPVLASFVAICLVASGNYGINEVCDAETDKHHPQKKFRALPLGRVKLSSVVLISLALYTIGLFLAWQLGGFSVLVSLGLFILTTGILYNVPPLRFKDVPFLDFILESFGNPVRLLVGWYAVTTKIVPVSFVLIFWCLGIVLMAGKRFAELRFLKDHAEIALYRKSLSFYTEEKLLLVMVSASMVLLYMFGVLSVKHEIDLVALLPFVVGFVVWYFHLAFAPDSIAKDPERIFENWPFVFYTLALALAFFLIFYYQFNYFSFFLDR